MKSPKINDMYQLLFDQMQIIKESTPQELESEAKKGDALARLADTMGTLAEKELRFYMATGLPPQEDGLFISGTPKQKIEFPKKNNLLVDEFTRGSVK